VKILLLGAGKIGAAVAELLAGSGDFEVAAVDQTRAALRGIPRGVERVVADVEDAATLRRLMRGQDAAVSALPFYLNVKVAEAARAAAIHYFDLTEDVETTHAISKLARGARSAFMPQCGLAPGFISIVANHVAAGFDTLDTVRMRVGALPQYPTNALNYNLTWSTDGLINEYCNPCEAIHEGKRIETLALEGLEHFALDGVAYEAFNTSGGLGTLADSLAGKVRELDYKTVRYPGHAERMRLLINDLKLGERRALLKDVLETAIPVTLQDVVLVFVTVTGRRGGRLMQESYASKIYAREVNGHVWSAIQRTTAAGIAAMVDLMREGKLKRRGFLRQENVRLETFLANRFGAVYAREAVNVAIGAAPR
jgi:saccharopine dehydrogenase-like NADP-dependent oxidoreductase